MGCLSVARRVTTCPVFPGAQAGCGHGLLTQVQEPMASPRAGAVCLVLEWRSERLLPEGTTESQWLQASARTACALMGLQPVGPGPHVAATHTLVADACQRPREILNFEAPSWRCSGKLSLLHNHPLLPKSECGVHPVGSASGWPSVRSLPLGGGSVHVSLPAGFVLESSPVYQRTCFISLSQLLRWSCVTEGSSVVFSVPLD